MMGEGRKEEERRVKSFAKPLALPGLRSWIAERRGTCGEWVVCSACCSPQPGFGSWAVSSWCLVSRGELAFGNTGALAERNANQGEQTAPS